MFICDISIWDKYGKLLLDERLLPCGVDWREMVIILVIERIPGVPQTRLTPFLQTDKGNVTKIIQTLEAKDMIFRTQDPSDHRSKLCHHTEQGLALVPELHRVMEAWTAECFAGIEQDDLQVFQRVGEQLTENMIKRIRRSQ